MFSIMNYQNFLNLELLKNQNLIASYMSNLKGKEKAKNGSQNGSSTSEGVENSNTSFPIIHNYLQSHIENKGVQSEGEP